MLFGIFWQNFMEYGNKGLVMDIEESGKKVEKLYYFECGSFIPHPYGGVDLWMEGNLVENHILEV